MIACIHVPRFAVEAERLRHPDIASRLILIGDARVLDCSLGAEASGVRDDDHGPDPDAGVQRGGEVCARRHQQGDPVTGPSNSTFCTCRPVLRSST